MMQGNGEDSLPSWLLSLIILGSSAAFCMLLFLVGRVIRAYRDPLQGKPSTISSGSLK